MDFLYSEDPIVACSTGNTSNCAIAVIRFSGFQDLFVFNKFLSISANEIEPRKARYCELLDGSDVVDQVVATFFKAPRSYNGENILELSVHGNVLNVEKIINLFVSKAGFRLAHPGEFSYRALKNRKLNLSQVEGLDLLLNANSNFSLEQGFSLLNGRLQQSYLDLEKAFLNHKSSVELSIDFLEDVGAKESRRQLEETLKSFKNKLNLLYYRAHGDSSKLINPEIVLIGQPNSGKSTFFNFLIKEDRSIVTEIAGTTRDYITENINVNDVYYRLVDTAGIRKSEDQIEMEGVRRSLAVVEKAFFKILLVNPFAFNLDYLNLVKDLHFDLILFTHLDRPGFLKEWQKLWQHPKFKDFFQKSAGSIGAESNGSIGAESSGSIGAVFKNVHNNQWLASLNAENPVLLKEFNQMVNKKYTSLVEQQPILLSRHKQKILESKQLLDEYCQVIESEEDISIISSELNNIGHCISELIGIVSPDDVLHNIFDNFCIGK
ncbi:MAG: GTPase [Bacteriovoracaceae bacterium]